MTLIKHDTSVCFVSDIAGVTPVVSELECYLSLLPKGGVTTEPVRAGSDRVGANILRAATAPIAPMAPEPRGRV